MAVTQAVNGSSVLTFGRHSGKTFAQMLAQEMDYCRWAVRQVSQSVSVATSGGSGGALGAFGKWLLSQGVEPKAQAKPITCGIVGGIPPDAYRIYTDGSCPGNGTKDQQAAGWGVVIYGGSFASSSPLELFGPVILDRTSSLWLGATVASNNTGELSAIGEAMHWLLYEDTGPSDRATMVMYDSDYAANIAQGKYVAKKNQELATRVQKLVAEVSKQRPIEFRHVKGHSSDPGNDRADALARDGVSGTWGSKSLRWSRAFQNVLGGKGRAAREATSSTSTSAVCQPPAKRPRQGLKEPESGAAPHAATPSVGAQAHAHAGAVVAGTPSASAAAASVAAAAAAGSLQTSAAAAQQGTALLRPSQNLGPDPQLVPTVLQGPFSGMPIKQMIRDYPEEAAAYLEKCQSLALHHAPRELERSVLRPNGAAA